MLTLWNT